MALRFSPIDTPVRDLEMWYAYGGQYSFAISYESRTGPGLHGLPGYVASWRYLHHKKPAVRLEGSPFNTFVEAEEACEVMLEQLSSEADAS